MGIKKDIRLKVWNKYNKRCAYCGEELEYKQMQVDHIVSKLQYEIQGGEGLNDFDNLNPSCRGCNFYKSANDLELFRKQLSTLHERIMKTFISRLGSKYKIIDIKPFDGKFYFEKFKQE